MKHSLPSLDALKVFEAAARLLSFSSAANELCLTRGAVSYHIQKLERQVGVALFHRQVRQIYLTNAGQKLFQSTQALLKQLGEEIEQIREQEYAKGLTIGATTYVSARFLTSRISQYLELKPDISFSFVHNVNASTFQLSSTDLTIHWGECDSSSLFSKEMPLFAVAAPALIQKYKIPANINLKDFATLAGGKIPLLNEDRDNDIWQLWHGTRLLKNPRRVITDANVRVQAAIEGQGFILADSLMQSEIDSGLLVRPLQHELAGFGYNLYCSPAKRLNTQCQNFADWLIDHF